MRRYTLVLGMPLAIGLVHCVGADPPIGSTGKTDAGTPADDDSGTTPVPDSSVPPDTGTVAPARKRVFVSSTATNAELGGNGIIGADQRCQTLALAGALGSGTFVAWLSNGAEHAIDRVSDVPYYLVDGTTLVATGKGGLATGLVANIGKDENGTDVVGTTHVWTGTEGDGTRASERCEDWTAAGGSKKAAIGSVGQTDTRWTSDGADDCVVQNRIYCFEL